MQGGGRYADVIGYHFYVSPKAPEAMIDLIERVRAIVDRHGLTGRPLWNTETGWFIANQKTVASAVGSSNDFQSRVLSDTEAADYVARALVLGWAGGLDRFYWYSWDNPLLGMTEADGQTVEVPAVAYRTVRDWMVGALMVSCQEGPDSVWVATFHRGRDTTELVAWSPGPVRRWKPGSALTIARVEDALGRPVTLPKSVTGGLAVDALPVLIEGTGP